MQKQGDLNRIAEKCKTLYRFLHFGLTVVIVGSDDAFRLERSGFDKSENIKNILKGQSLSDVHRQYLQTFLIDLQAEISRFRCFAYFLKT